MLIRKWYGSKQVEWELWKTERFGSILLVSWSGSGVCGLGAEITVALRDGSGVARHKQQ